MRQIPKKHMCYFNVLESFQKATVCALCELESRSVRRYLENLLYEHVNDVGVRGDLVGSRGYCHRHAHLLLECADGLGTAILYEDQAKLFLEFLNGLRGLSCNELRKAVSETWNRDALCPACMIRAQSRDRYLGTLLDWLDDLPMQEAIADSPGLCVPHLLRALRTCHDAKCREYLIATHVAKFTDLLNDLHEFMRKHDYRLSKGGFGKEADSWRRVVTMLVGMKDVF